MWTNSSRCRIVSVYLTRMWCLYSWLLPRYSHNYALFYQLLDSNLFTHHNTCYHERSHLWNLWPPGLFYILLVSRQLANFCRRLFCNLYFPIYTTKIPKIFILLSLWDLTFASGREGIDNPFIALVARFLFVCVGARDLSVASYWIDTLVLKNWGKYLCYIAASPFPLQRENQPMLKR